MLEQLLNLVKENAQDAIVNNNAIPNQHNDAAIGEATNAIHDQLSQAVSGGNLQDVLGLFGNAQNLTSNPLVGNIISQLAGSLGSKFGVDGSQAQNIASSLIPQVLGKLSNKTNDPADSSFNVNDIMSHLAGGGGTKGVDFGNIVSQMQHGGGVDIAGLAGQFLGGNKRGIGDLLGGFLGK
jgi:hypothetical protein